VTPQGSIADVDALAAPLMSDYSLGGTLGDPNSTPPSSKPSSKGGSADHIEGVDWNGSESSRYPAPGGGGGTGDPLPVVLFAGEATHVNLMGTMGGAFLTGVREAQRLLQAWGVS
jgi:Flavin containing amine oxidoreductase